MKIRTGAPPAAITDPDSGTVLTTMALPSDWMASASGGSKAKNGDWQDLSADASGTAGHFRIYASDGITPHLQGTITGEGGGGDMELNSTAINAGQQVTIVTFVLSDGN